MPRGPSAEGVRGTSRLNRRWTSLRREQADLLPIELDADHLHFRLDFPNDIGVATRYGVPVDDALQRFLGSYFGREMGRAGTPATPDSHAHERVRLDVAHVAGMAAVLGARR